MAALQIPPDATAFRSGGTQFFLYMGPLEMRALQREWGLTRLANDTADEWQAKCVCFGDRLNGGSLYGMEEKIPVFRHALTRWAAAAGVDPVTLTDERVSEIVSNVDRGRRKKRKAGFVYANDLYLQFINDCFVESEEEEPEKSAEEEDSDAAPKVRNRKPEVSTPSVT